MTSLQDKLKNLPQKPGVYIFRDSQGRVLYVGKAKNLKNRVRSYFLHTEDERGPRIALMKSQIADLDYIVVSSEVESLILENNLIKQYHPRYNVSMRDDKNFAFIKIDYDSEIPQIYPVRKIETSKRVRPLPHLPQAWGRKTRADSKRQERSKFFGPYTTSVKPTLKLVNNIFHLCRNKKVGSKPCFAYHLSRCPGVCIGKVSLAEYKKTLKQAEEFLKNRQTEVIKNFRSQMRQAAGGRQFERAAALRDKIYYLEHLWQRQKIISTKNVSQDFVGLYPAGNLAVICLFVVRIGKLIHTEYFTLETQSSSGPEILEKFILQYYQESSNLPKEIFVPELPGRKDLLKRALAKLRQTKVTISTPRKGKKKQLLELATENAKLYFEREEAGSENQIGAVLLDLQNLLDLPVLPERIEGYDISNIQGRSPVGSMVVFSAPGGSVSGGEKFGPEKSQYRKFKINVKETPDDFAMMREMLERRFRHLPLVRGRLRGGRGADTTMTSPTPPHEKGNNTGWLAPDLIIIDGGKGQLNVAVQVLKKYNLNIPAIGLAKRLEEIFLPGRKDSIILEPNSPVLFLLQRIRDEAHRFAITFYRTRHRKAGVRSILDEIPGVGPMTKKKLLKTFGTVHAIRAASLEEIGKKISAVLAKRIKERL